MGTGGYPRAIITRLAEMRMVAPRSLEQRFHHGAELDPAGFQENKRARFALIGDEPNLMLSVMSPDVNSEVRITTSDHFAPERGKDPLMALVVVAQDNVAEMVTKLDFSYFPQLFRIRIFTDEEEARAWLLAQREDIVHSESGDARQWSSHHKRKAGACAPAFPGSCSCQYQFSTRRTIVGTPPFNKRTKYRPAC